MLRLRIEFCIPSNPPYPIPSFLSVSPCLRGNPLTITTIADLAENENLHQERNFPRLLRVLSRVVWNKNQYHICEWESGE